MSASFSALDPIYGRILGRLDLQAHRSGQSPEYEVPQDSWHGRGRHMSDRPQTPATGTSPHSPASSPSNIKQK